MKQNHLIFLAFGLALSNGAIAQDHSQHQAQSPVAAEHENDHENHAQNHAEHHDLSLIHI